MLYDLKAVVEKYTGESLDRWGIVCPMPHHKHTNYTPSFSVYNHRDGRQYFKCKGNCGAQGDVIDFVGYMTIPGYNPRDGRHIQEAIQNLGHEPIRVFNPTREKKTKVLNPIRTRLEVEEWHEALWHNILAQEYLEQRGVLQVARRFMLGYRYLPKAKGSGQPGHYISIPNLQHGTYLNVKFRRIDSYYGDNKPIRYDSLTGGQMGLFNHDEVFLRTGPVFVPEGEFDVMLLEALGFKACCLTGGAAGYDSILNLALEHARPIIIEEPDKAGKSGAAKKQKKLPNSIVVTTGHKDVGDMYDKEGAQAVIEWAMQYVES